MWRRAASAGARSDAPSEARIELLEQRPGDVEIHNEDERRRSQGHRLYGIVPDGRPLAWGWAAMPRCRVVLLFDTHFDVPEGSVYIWDCVTEIQARNNGYFRALLQQIPLAVDRAGTAYVAVDTRNRASCAAINRAGYDLLFSYYSLRIFGVVCLSFGVHGGRVIMLRRLLDELAELA